MDNTPPSPSYEELRATCAALSKECDELRKALNSRNEIEGKAHGLFTSPLANGQRFAHTPDQCNSLGFVQVMRQALAETLSECARDKQQLDRLLKVMKQWRMNWNILQVFSTKDIDTEIVSLQSLIHKMDAPIANPYILSRMEYED